MENYEKKYKEALERAKMINSGEDVDVAAGTTICEYIFPELQESEDEKIRKALINFFNKGAENGAQTNGVCDKDIIAWLKKQGKKEQDARYKYLEELLEADTIYQMAMNDAMVEEAKAKALEAISNMEIFELLVIKKQGEKKSDWNEEDERIIKRINSLLYAIHESEFEDIHAWLKSLKQRIGR